MNLTELYAKADYQDEMGMLFHGDCMSLLKEINDNCIDLVVTDPPYGIDLTPQRENGKFKNTKVINDDNLTWLPNFVEEIYRISKNVVCVFCGWQNIDKFKIEFEKKFVVKNILVWNKDWFGMGNNYRPNYELILLCCKTNIKTKSNNKSNPKFKCEWCGCGCNVINEHHYPIPKSKGGTDIVKICPNCHSEFHSLYKISRKGGV